MCQPAARELLANEFSEALPGSRRPNKPEEHVGKCFSLLLILHVLKEEELLLCSTIHECVFQLGPVENMDHYDLGHYYELDVKKIRCDVLLLATKSEF